MRLLAIMVGSVLFAGAAPAAPAADAALAPTKALQDRLYNEIVSRVKQDDSSVPYLKHRWWYYTRFDAGADCPILARRKGDMTAPEAVMPDQPKMAVGKGFFVVGDWVAKLRATKTDANPLLFRINMEAGHGGKSGRFRAYRDTAEYYAFMLTQLGINS